MNFLAHALLSPSEPVGVRVGNMTADFIKGKARLALPADLQAGIALHRRIDAFTDTHAAVARCRELLTPRWGRYAGVLVDVFFDHCLAARWERWHDGAALGPYVQRLYAELADHMALLPERAQMAVAAMIADDWLTPYARLEGIHLALSRMSRRLQHRGHGVELAPSVDDFAAHRDAFFEAFEIFMPAVRRHVSTGPQMITDGHRLNGGLES